MSLKSTKWTSVEFESSIIKTEQFKKFSKDFLSDIKKTMEGYKLVNKNVGHFYISGFLKKDEKYVYFSTSDVRFFRNEWYNNILIRTAKNDKDYTGGSNNHSTLEDLKRKVDLLSK